MSYSKRVLFKLYNVKVDLPRNRLLVDEAGMVGNSDYLELLKVVMSNNCNLILVGDERQLTSVERGGMFAVFASKFGSYVHAFCKIRYCRWPAVIRTAYWFKD